MTTTSTARPLAGATAIGFAVVFNLIYGQLAASFEYPQILRLPVGEILTRFEAGGPLLILTWYGFALTALGLVPVSLVLALQRHWVAERPALAIGAAISGALAGLTQAMGLLRWVDAVPDLAHTVTAAGSDAMTRVAAEQGFALLHGWAGVAIGEQMGQMLTALFALLLALLVGRDGRVWIGRLGLASAAILAIGTLEGIVTAMGGKGAPFALTTIAGYLVFSIWLIALGLGEFGLGRKPIRP